MNRLTLSNISKSFDNTLVLDDISLELNEGELLVLLGPSGCGKSTLLRLIAGLEKLSNGNIYLNDKQIDHLPPKDRKVAMVFQNYSLYPHMTVEKNLAFPLKIAKLNKSRIKEKVAETAEMLGLTEKLYNKPGQLSGGQRQRVALGRAVIREPSIFLLDEPLSNLDADLRARMRTEICRIQRELSTTTIHVTHDQAEALSMADRICLLNNGKIEQLDTPEQMYKKPLTLFAARFIGFPKINIVTVKIENNRLIPFGVMVEDYYVEDGSNELIMGIRPEDISIKGGPYEGKVTGCEYFGEQYILTIAFDEISLTVSGSPVPHKISEKINFSIDEAKLHFFSKSSGKRLF